MFRKSCACQTPKYRLVNFLFITTKRKAGHLTSACRLIRLSDTSQITNRFDAHAIGKYDSPHKGVRDGLLAVCTPNGTHIIPSRSIYLCNVFDLGY